MREKYDALIAKPVEIEAILVEGAIKARRIATPLLRDLRHAVGLRDLRSAPGAGVARERPKSALPTFKQYREKDGRFHFKLIAADGRELLVSDGFASPREAGELIARLKSGDDQAFGAAVGGAGDGVDADEIRAALAAFADPA